MWQLLNANSGAVQACSAVVIVLLTVVLAGATIRYVRLTDRIATASATQTEAVHKPVLTLRQVEAPTTTDIAPTQADIAELSKQVGDAMKGKQHTHIGPVLEIINIGTGPALRVRWTLKRFSDTGGFIPYVEVGQCVSLKMASKVKMPAVPTSFQVECRYKSISGLNYLSRTSIENNQEISNFEFGLEIL
jgi:hypothetical protein